MTRPSLRAVYDRLPIAAQELLVAAAGWRSHRARFGAPFRRVLHELRETDALDADGVRRDQERRLREMVAFAAATVPYYRELFQHEGIDPAAIRGLDDLSRIPLLDKETVRARAVEFKSEAVPSREILPAHSSGSTGSALPLFHSREGLGWEYAVIWRQREWFGLQPGERFAAFGGQPVVPLAQQEPPFWRYDRARARMLFSLYHMTASNLRCYASELRRGGYRFWQGYPSSLALVSGALLDHGVELGDAAPRAVFTSSETLLDFQRERITRAALGASVADRYGNSELSVSALQCPEGGYHVDTEFCAVEIDPHEETDEWVRGEVISTGFANRAMPFLRYRTGDVATLRKRGGCACGRARPQLERIDGRLEDYVVTPDGRRVGRLDHVFKDALAVQEAQIHQSDTHRILVRIVPRPEFDAAAQRRLEREFRKRLGGQILIDFDEVQAIPRLANGKFRAVISELPEGKAR
jgi:phenylacetate-CoA ligase